MVRSGGGSRIPHPQSRTVAAKARGPEKAAISMSLHPSLLRSSRLSGLILASLVMAVTPLHAEVYQEPAAFVAGAFDGDPPAPRVLWLSGDLRARVSEILGHRPAALRVRYWARGQRSAWVLEEIGKEKPITVGIVIDRDRIETLRVLAFRESRGWEVRRPFFTDQFTGAGLGPNDALDRNIDGISGATLSVRALTRLARMALLLDRSRRQPDVP